MTPTERHYARLGLAERIAEVERARRVTGIWTIAIATVLVASLVAMPAVTMIERLAQHSAENE